MNQWKELDDKYGNDAHYQEYRMRYTNRRYTSAQQRDFARSYDYQRSAVVQRDANQISDTMRSLSVSKMKDLTLLTPKPEAPLERDLDIEEEPQIIGIPRTTLLSINAQHRPDLTAVFEQTNAKIKRERSGISIALRDIVPLLRAIHKPGLSYRGLFEGGINHNEQQVFRLSQEFTRHLAHNDGEHEQTLSSQIVNGTYATIDAVIAYGHATNTKMNMFA